jgi:hypothetical protein
MLFGYYRSRKEVPYLTNGMVQQHRRMEIAPLPKRDELNFILREDVGT